MKKSLLALAAMGAFAGAAHAQSSVTVYGILDLGLTNVTNDNGTNTTSARTTAEGGAYTTQRLGVRGTEDLGKGLRANFNFEMGLGSNGAVGNRIRAAGTTTADTANTADYKADQSLSDLNVRQQNVGLAGSFGSVRIGRMTTLADVVIGLGDVGGGNNFQGRAYSNTTAGGTNLINARSDRLIEYVSPTMSGLSIGVQYGTAAGTNSTTVAAERLNENSATEFGAMIRYSAGPASAGIGFQSHKEKISNADRRESTVMVVAGSYNFKVAQAFFNYQNGEIKNDYATATTPTQAAPFSTVAFQTGALNKRNVSEIGVAVPVGALRLAGSYYMGTRENQTSATGAVAKSDLTGYQAAALYSLSKRTNLYAVYGATKSDTAGVATNVADYGIGVRHSF
jgi:predicted porin